MRTEHVHTITEGVRPLPRPGVYTTQVAAMNPVLCWYCCHPATVRCTEKLCSPWISFPPDLERYALIQDSDLEWSMVESVERRLISTPTVPWLNDEVVVVTLRRKHGLVERRLRPLLPVLELKNLPCDRPACDTHARDLGDGHHFRCYQHWHEDAPRPMEETLRANEWAGLLESSIELRKQERRK